MANRPHPDKQAITWRLHRDLIAAMRAAAAARGEDVTAFVTRALHLEVARTDLENHNKNPGAGGNQPGA